MSVESLQMAPRINFKEERYRSVSEFDRDTVLDMSDVGDGLTKLFDTLRRRALLIGATVLLFQLLTLLYLMLTPPVYTAVGAFLIDPTVSQDPSYRSQVSPSLLQTDALTVDSELLVMTSREVTTAVVEALGLLEQDGTAPSTEEVGDTPRTGSITTNLRNSVNAFLSDIMMIRTDPSDQDDPPGDDKESNAAILSREDQEARWVEAVRRDFARRLKIERQGETFVVDVSYTSPDIVFATDAVNTLMQEYLRASAAHQRALIERNQNWLKDRLDQLSEEVDAAETALAQFRRQNSLMVPEGQSLPVEVALNASVQGLARLRAQSLAQEVLVTQLSEQIASGDVESVRVPPEDRTPALIQFETRYAELQQQEQQLLQRLQEDEPMVRDVRLEQGQLRDLMLREFRRIRDRIDNRSKALQREVSATEASIDALRSDYGNDADLMIELRQFERQATIKRDLYEELLEQYNSASQLLTFEGATARVLAWAVPPERKSGPASKKLALLAAFGGFVFGAGIALLLDLVERGYRRNRDLVRDLNVPVLGVFPKLRRNGLGEISQRLAGTRRRGTAIRTPRPLRKYVFAANFRGSVAAEAMRSIHVRLLLKRNAPGPQTSGHVVGITSTADGEGKTMTAVNLAAYLAEQGESVALLDTDLFKKTLSIDVAKAVPRQNDIMRLMRDPTLACEAFQPTDLYEGLYVIGFIGGKEAAHLKTRDLQHFEEAVRRLRARFDYILLDLPPAQGEPRTQLLERYCDELVYVVHWGKTVRDSVKAIFQNHRINTQRVLGVLFTQAPLGAYRAYNRTELHH